MDSKRKFDVIIIGGSYAGLAAAMSLGRSLRTVLIIDSGLPCNRQTPHSHNFLTNDGSTPSELAEKAKEQVLKYDTVKFHTELAVEGYKTANGFSIVTKSGEEFEARKLIFATGIRDIFPSIDGFSECWGISIIHCPYCHGYEFQGQKTGIITSGEGAMHLVPLVHNLTSRVTVLTNGFVDLSDDLRMKLKMHNIGLVETGIAEFEHENGQVKKVIFLDDTTMDFNAIYAPVPFEQHSNIPGILGCELTEYGHIQVDNFQKTNVDGIFACGDNSSMMRSVSNAVATGHLTGGMVNKELSDAQF